jgi:hypothetical protein
MGAGGFDGFRQKHDVHKSSPRLAPIDEVLTRQCPCLGLSIHERRAWALADSMASDRNRMYTRVYPGSPLEGKDLHPACLILYCLHSWSYYNGGADEIWLWSKKRRVLAYACGGDWIYARLEISLLLSRPSLPLYGGRGLGIRSKSVTGVCKT